MSAYTEADQRADTAFLVGVTHGRDTVRAKVEQLPALWDQLALACGDDTARARGYTFAAEQLRDALSEEATA